MRLPPRPAPKVPEARAIGPAPRAVWPRKTDEPRGKRDADAEPAARTLLGPTTPVDASGRGLMAAIEDVLHRNPGLQHVRDIVTALALPAALNVRAFAFLQTLATSGRITREGSVLYVTRKPGAAPASDLVAPPPLSSTTMLRVKRCNTCGRTVLRRATRSAQEPLTGAEETALEAHAATCWPSSSILPKETTVLPALWTSTPVE